MLMVPRNQGITNEHGPNILKFGSKTIETWGNKQVEDFQELRIPIYFRIIA